MRTPCRTSKAPNHPVRPTYLRREWFELMKEACLALWWVPKGHRPDVAEAIAKLEQLKAKGPGPEAFTFSRPFPPPA